MIQNLKTLSGALLGIAFFSLLSACGKLAQFAPAKPFTPSDSPIHIRGGSVAIHHKAQNWRQNAKNSNVWEIDNVDANFIHLGDVGAVGSNTPDKTETVHNPTTNWMIALNFRKSDGSVNAGSPELDICTELSDDAKKCVVDSNTLASPANVYVVPDANGAAALDPASIDNEPPALRFNVSMCNGNSGMGSICDHVYLVTYTVFKSGNPKSTQYQCVFGTCDIGIDKK